VLEFFTRRAAVAPRLVDSRKLTANSDEISSFSKSEMLSFQRFAEYRGLCTNVHILFSATWQLFLRRLMGLSAEANFGTLNHDGTTNTTAIN